MILRGQHADHYINEDGLEYLKARKFPEEKRILLKRLLGKTFPDEESYMQALKAFGIREERHLRRAYEAGLMGSIRKRYPSFPIIVSDDAGQFKVFNHAGCWIHAERRLSKLIPNNAVEKEPLDTALERYWSLYKELRAYQQEASTAKKEQLELKFDEIFTANTDYPELNEALKATHNHKQDLLAILDYPYIPLHNNISERDIREVAKKRKISAGSRMPMKRADEALCRGGGRISINSALRGCLTWGAEASQEGTEGGFCWDQTGLFLHRWRH